MRELLEGGGGQGDVGGRGGGTAEEDGVLGLVVGHHMAPLMVDGTRRKAFPPLPTPKHPNPKRQGLKESLPRCHVSYTKICSPTVLQIRCVNYRCAELWGCSVQRSCRQPTQILHSVHRKAESDGTNGNIPLRRYVPLFPRRVTLDVLMCTACGEGAGSCWAHNSKAQGRAKAPRGMLPP